MIMAKKKMKTKTDKGCGGKGGSCKAKNPTKKKTRYA